MTEQELSNLMRDSYAKALETLVEIMQLGTPENKLSAAATVIDIAAPVQVPR